MKVLILTNPEHKDFVWDFVKNYTDHRIYLFDFEKHFGNFPNDYDIGISFMYQHKVPAKEVNTHKWYNFHPAPLPAYKGRNLCYHAIMNGETEFGASLHCMDENFDTGAIIDVWHFDIAPHMTAGDVSRDAIETSKALFQEYFPQILEDFPFATIPNVGGTYYKKSPIVDVEKEHPNSHFGRFVRAVTAGNFYPKIDIGGRIFKIVPEEE